MKPNLIFSRQTCLSAVLIAVFLLPLNATVFATKTTTNPRNEMQEYFIWRQELDNAESRRRSNNVIQNVIVGTTLVSLGVYAVSSSAPNSFVGLGIAFVGGAFALPYRKNTQDAALRIQALNREGQSRGWIHGPPVSSNSVNNQENKDLDLLGRLEALKGLRDSGVITEEEYEAARLELLKKL